MPLTVSVIIPTYNRASQVLGAVQSAQQQSVAPTEILVIDDGSTDDTQDLFLDVRPPVHFVRQANGGVSSARNRGLELARGDVIAFLDSDDAWETTWLERALEVLASERDAGAVCADLRYVDTSGKAVSFKSMGSIAVSGRIPLPTLFSERIALGSNFCVRRSVLLQCGYFDVSLSTGEDVDLALRVAAISEIRWVPEVLISITRSIGSLSGNLNTGNRLRVFEKFASRHPELATRYARELRTARAQTALSYARDLTWSRDLGNATTRARESWRYKPSFEAAFLLSKIVALRLFGR